MTAYCKTWQQQPIFTLVKAERKVGYILHIMPLPFGISQVVLDGLVSNPAGVSIPNISVKINEI